ncbi:endospore germination permease [Oscillospiraceae bacterium OttesenSCG-928-G22]|nr:endospore germination permease [Oscillospiraceae bacterium OttesenSCG-928-G22]
MQQEQLSFRNGCNLIIIFIICTNVISGLPIGLKQDNWLGLLAAALLAVPVLFLYARLMKLMPGMHLFQMLETVFGKWAGRALSLVITVYCIHLAALVLRNFSEFFHITSFSQTPLAVILIALAMVSMYLAASGYATLGKWSGCILIAGASVMAFLVCASASAMDFRNVKPVMEHSLGEIFSGGLKLASYPLFEVVILLTFADAMPRSKSPYKLLFAGMYLAVFFLLVIFFRSLLVLGAETLNTVYFPTYRAASIIRLGNFFERIESLTTFTYILAGITKISCCLIGAGNGFSTAFRLSSRRDVIVPVSLLTIAIAAIVHKSSVDMYAFVAPYRVFAPFFQVLIPLVLWIVAEIRFRKKRGANTQETETLAKSGA